MPRQSDSQNQARPGYPPAIVVGFEANGLGVSRALYKRGIDCIGVGVPWWQAAYATRSCRIVQCESWTEDAFIGQLISIASELWQQAPLIITKDEPVLWVSRHRHELSEHFEICLPQHETVELMMSKIRFLALARDEGWPVPVTVIVNSRSELDSCLSDVPYPCILKPAEKNSAFRAHAPVKAYRISSAAELVDRYNFIAQWEEAAVIQEWIAGGDDRIAFCLACYSRRSEPLALFAGRKLRQFPIDCGNTAVAAPAPDHWHDPILNLSQEIFAKLEYQGIGSIEYKMRDDGTPVIMEPTVGRTNWQNEIAVINGVDIPSIAYFDMIGSTELPPAVSVAPCKLVDGRAHRRAFFQQYRAGTLSVSQWLDERRGKKRYIMWRPSDPGPFLSATIGKGIRFAIRLPMRIFRKLHSFMS